MAGGLLLAGTPRLVLEHLVELLPGLDAVWAVDWRAAGAHGRRLVPDFVVLDERGAAGGLLDALAELELPATVRRVVAVSAASFARAGWADRIVSLTQAELVISTPLDAHVLARWLASPAPAGPPAAASRTVSQERLRQRLVKSCLLRTERLGAGAEEELRTSLWSLGLTAAVERLDAGDRAGLRNALEVQTAVEPEERVWARPLLLTERCSAERRLGQAGLPVTVATPHRRALQQLQAERPSLIILDLATDTENRVQLLRELTSRFPHLPCVALTESGTSASKAALTQAGAHEIVSWAEGPRRLVAEVQRLERRARPYPRLLVADPDPERVAALESWLEPLGAVLETLPNSHQFWEAADLVDPDIFILNSDLHPLPTGELCRTLRTHRRYQDRPVLVVAPPPLDWRQLIDWGADDGLLLSASQEEVVAKVWGRLARAAYYRQQADRDPLTGLATRRRGRRDLERLLRLSRRYRQPCTLAILDLDHFKSLNDEYGHATGDRALRHVSRWLSASVRVDDVVVRWGGEEFVMGLYGADAEHACERLERLREELSADEFTGEQGERLRVSFSGGVAQFPPQGKTVDELLSVADRALYAAKAAGRARVCQGSA